MVPSNRPESNRFPHPIPDSMTRWWNQFQSLFYSRLRWLPELAAGRVAKPAEDLPLPPLATPVPELGAATIGIVTAGGLHLRTDPPFDMQNPDGDGSYRVIPSDAPPEALTITHDYYDHSAADRDRNCVLPIDRLSELVRAGEVGGVAPRHVGMMGHLLGAQREKLIRSTAREIADLFREDGVDIVLATPG